MKNKINKNLPNWLLELDSKLKAKVSWDTVTLQLYSTAACLFEISPLAVVIPHNIEDVITTVEICKKYQIPILPRGAGSSLSGNAVGKAVILDMTQHFNKIEIVTEGLVNCGVGVVLNDLQKYLFPYRCKFGPDPSSGNICVIGGMLGNNSGGPHTIKHGNMYKHVEEINLILSNGKIFKAKNIPLNEISSLDDFHRPYYEKVRELLIEYSKEIINSKPHATKNSSGYQVWDILTTTHLNMASLMVGSEGTLGIFIDAVLNTIPLIKHRGLISLYFTDLQKMGIAVQHLRNLEASAIEFVDHSFIKLALSFKPELRRFLPESVKYLLYVEFEDNKLENIENKLIEAKKIISEKNKLADVGAFSTNETEIENILKVRKAATVILNKIQGNEKPAPFTEDAAVHPDVFPEFLVALSEMMNKYPFNYAMFGHAGDGNLHLRPILNFKDKQSFDFANELMNEYVDIILKFKGTLCGEHGDGRLRAQFLEKFFPQLIPLFREIKTLFDPVGIMHPEMKLPVRTYNWNDNLRYSPNYSYLPISSKLDSDLWREEIEKCHGCGTCREYCPVFKATGREDATARAKANILRGILSGKIDQSVFVSKQFYKIMDYCFNCAQCLTDCPTAVNIPGIVILAKEKLYKKKYYKINEFILQRGRQVSRLSSILSPLSNKILSNVLVRKVMHYITGIDRRREFPTFSRYRKYSSEQIEQRKKVVLWSGCAAQFNDPDGELENSIQLLKKLNFDVILPDWKCCNIAKISYGNISGSIRDIEYNINVLLPYAEQKIPIVFSSASCGYAFMHEYIDLFSDNSALIKIAEDSYDIHSFLGNVFLENKFEGDFIPINKQAVYHAPCHLKAQKAKYSPIDLLSLIPNLEIKKIEDACCGIAGTYGMKKENFDMSMKIGSKLFAEIKRVKPDFVLSGCGTCQIQIKQGTNVVTIHPVTLLNQSFEGSRKLNVNKFL